MLFKIHGLHNHVKGLRVEVMRRKLAKARRLTEIENRFSENFLQGMVGGIYYSSRNKFDHVL